MFFSYHDGNALTVSELMEEPEGFENESEDDELMAPQKEKGDGEDEGEREEALPE